MEYLLDGRLKLRNSFCDGRNRTTFLITEKINPILESDTSTGDLFIFN